MKENKEKYELTKFEKELLVFLQKEGYRYIGKDKRGEFEPPRLVASDEKMSYHNLAELFNTYKKKTVYLEGPFGKLFKFIWCGHQFKIQELLENCEVIENE